MSQSSNLDEVKKFHSHIAQPGSGTHPTLYQMGTVSYFTWDKAAGA
jgi:hypothetical protein